MGGYTNAFMYFLKKTHHFKALLKNVTTPPPLTPHLRFPFVFIQGDRLNQHRGKKSHRQKDTTDSQSKGTSTLETTAKRAICLEPCERWRGSTPHCRWGSMMS